MEFLIDRYDVTTIGRVDKEVGASDQYVLIRDRNGDVSIDDVRSMLLRSCYWDTDTPGAYFCHNVQVIPTNSENECIGIIHHQYNV